MGYEPSTTRHPPSGQENLTQVRRFHDNGRRPSPVGGGDDCEPKLFRSLLKVPGSGQMAQQLNERATWFDHIGGKTIHFHELVVDKKESLSRVEHRQTLRQVIQCGLQ